MWERLIFLQVNCGFKCQTPPKKHHKSSACDVLFKKSENVFVIVGQSFLFKCPLQLSGEHNDDK